MPTYVAILPRDGEAKDVRWFKGPERGAIHLLNGITKGNKVIVDAPVSDGNPFPHFPSADGSPWNPQKARTVMRRWTFDLSSNKEGWDEEILFPQTPGLLPRIDERYWSLPHRYGFIGYGDPALPLDERAASMRGRVNNCYGRMDFATGQVNSYFVGDACSLQEVQFIPRKKDSPEGDGYLIGVAANYAEMRSELVIVDAQHLEDGDIARVILPFRLAPQIHGWWVGADQLPLNPDAGLDLELRVGAAGGSSPTRGANNINELRSICNPNSGARPGVSAMRSRLNSSPCQHDGELPPACQPTPRTSQLILDRSND